GRVPHVARVRGAGCGPRLVGDGTLRAATAATAGCAGHLRGRVPQARADLVDLEFDRGALVAVAVVVGALLEAAGRDDAAALRERPGHVLGELAPARRAEEQRLAVLPLVARAIEGAGRRRDREVRDRKTRLRVTQLGVGGEVAHDRDDRLAGHGLLGVLVGLGGGL